MIALKDHALTRTQRFDSRAARTYVAGTYDNNFHSSDEDSTAVNEHNVTRDCGYANLRGAANVRLRTGFHWYQRHR